MSNPDDQMSMIVKGGALFVAVLLTCLPLAKFLGRYGLIDRPNARSSHDLPTVRGGGMVLVAAVMLCLPYECRGHEPVSFFVGFCLIAGISLTDDLKALPALVRLFVHLFGALIFVIPQVLDSDSSSVAFQIAQLLTGVILLVGYTNAFNFMDGINGLATAQAAITGLGTAALGVTAGESVTSFAVATGFIVGLASLGFFPHNFPKARMFMGDVGSAPIGFALAAAAFGLALHYGWAMAVSLTLLHANFLLDTGLTLLRRILRGDNWLQAHREHFYQRLVRSGYSHTRTTCIEISMQVVVAAIVVETYRSAIELTFELIPCIVAAWFIFFAICESKFRQSAATPS
jgi:Fuc2NAc and GlcNAc transferase